MVNDARGPYDAGAMARKKTRPQSKKKPRNAKRAPARPARSEALLAQPQERWLDDLAERIVLGGGPRFSRAEVLRALIDANTGRSLDPKKIRDAEDLRIAFGAPDLSRVEAALKDRPKIEPNVLDALRDALK